MASSDGRRHGKIINPGSETWESIERELEKLSSSRTPETTAGTDKAAQVAVRGRSSPIRIVLFGKTGVGKSATCNMILGKRCSKEKTSQSSVTLNCQKYTALLQGGREISIVDTPGLFDTKRTKEETIDSIVNCTELSSPGPHAFLMILSCRTRYTEEENDTLMELKSLFGEEVYRHTIVLFTNADALDCTPEEYCKEFPSNLKDVIKSCNGRVVFVNNKGNYKKHSDEILGIVEDIVDERKEYYKSNKMFKEHSNEKRTIIQSFVEEEIDKKLSQIEVLKQEIEKLEKMDGAIDTQKGNEHKDTTMDEKEIVKELEEKISFLQKAIIKLKQRNMFSFVNILITRHGKFSPFNLKIGDSVPNTRLISSLGPFSNSSSTRHIDQTQ